MHLELKQQICSYIWVVSLKTMHISSRLKWAKSIPVIGLNCCYNHTLWGGTYLFSLYKGVSTLLLHAWHTMSISKLYGMASTLHMLGTAVSPWQWQPWTVVMPSLGFTSMAKTVRPCFPFLLIYLQIKQV